MASYTRVGSKMEEKIRKELGASSPIPWTADNTAQERGTGEKLHDGRIGAFGGKLDTRNRFTFNLPGTRPTTLRVAIVQAGIAGSTWPSELFYVTEMPKPLNSSIQLFKEGILRPKFMFAGDPQICSKLNSDQSLTKLASYFYTQQIKTGNLTLSVTPYVGVQPTEKGSNLVILTLPRFNWTGKPIFGVKEFFTLASKLETML